MHEMLNSFKQKPIKNFNKKSSILKNPKIVLKPQNLGFEMWYSCKWERRTLPSEEKNLKKLEKHLGMRFGVRESVLGGEKTSLSRERSRKMRRKLQFVLK